MKTKLTLLLALFLTINLFVSAQEITEEWTVENQNIKNLQVLYHTDGYIYVGGNNYTTENSSVFISKYNSSGTVLWTTYYENQPQKDKNFKKMIIQDNYIYILAELKDTSSASNIVYSDVLTLKYTMTGMLLLDLIFNNPDNLESCPKEICVYKNDIYIAIDIKTEAELNTADVILVKYDSNGIPKWNVRYGNEFNSTDWVWALHVDDVKNVYLSIRSQTSTTSDLNIKIHKYNSSGELIWSNSFINTFYHHISECYNRSNLAIDENYNVYLFSYLNKNDNMYPMILKYDSQGNLLFSVIDTTDNMISNIIDRHSKFYLDSANTLHVQYILNNWQNDGFTEREVVYVKYDTLGNKIFYKKWTSNSFANRGNINDFKIDDKYNLYITGSNYISKNLNNTDAYCLTEKIDSNNQKVWSAVKNWIGTKDSGFSLSIDNEENVYIIGLSPESYIWIDEANEISSSILTKYSSYSNSTIKGTVFNDENGNCVKDSAEKGIPNILLKTETSDFYSITDSIGDFTFWLDTGTYNIKILTNEYWSEICSENQQYLVQLTPENNTISDINFSIKPNKICPVLTVDITTSRLRRCAANNFYKISYINTGIIPAENTYITVDFDKNIIPISSTLEWTSKKDNLYTFNIGTLKQNESGNFNVTDSVSCDANLGLTLCTEARIYADALCNEIIDSTWDKSSIKVTGECIGDSLVCFVIKNTGEYGNGDMDGESTIRIFEDNFLKEIFTFQLTGGDSLIKCFSANGKTYRLEADQRPGHPGNSYPKATIENCGISDNPSLGFVTTVPEDDYAKNIEIDCHEIIGSYDPNEKYVKPKGISTLKYIKPTDNFEYQITFQNTGTDTAFLVIIRDTLSQFLDITTVQNGTSSHDNCIFRIYGSNILEWRFNNILLPDSNVDKLGSNGFVSFKISQNANNPIGSEIKNSAAIIFDYNEPVITNQTLNVISDTIFKFDYSAIPEYKTSNNNIKIYPNPFNNTANLFVDANILNENKNIELIIYDLVGRELKKIKIKENYTKIHRNSLKNGVYLFKVSSKDRTIDNGKIIVK